MERKNKIAFSIFLVLSLFLTSTIVLATSPQTSEVVMTAHVSLGNSTCTAWECDRTNVYFFLPLGTDKPQYVKFIIYPECLGIPPNASETWAVNMLCINGFNETIDLKQAMCQQTEGIIRWIDLKANTTEYFSYNNVQYERYWCRFTRTSDSIERTPLEFSLVVDSLGLSNPEEETVFTRQRVTASSIVSGIEELFTINFNILQIGFYLLGAIIVIVGFVALIGFIPLLLKWIMKRVSA